MPFIVRSTRVADRQIAGLRGARRKAYDLFEMALARRGCEGLDYRLTGEAPLPSLCVKHLRGNDRAVVRLPAIVEKLVRLPNLPLSSMQDIGGVRAILDSIEEVRRVEAHVKRIRPPVGYRDHISSPRSSGYRGVHVIVMYDDRQIEIQLRTQVMHAWAITIERVSSRLGQNLKGDGKHAVQTLMASISQAMALEEEGQIVDPDLLSEIDRLRVEASPYLQGGR